MHVRRPVDHPHRPCPHLLSHLCNPYTWCNSTQVDDVVFALDESLRPAASGIAMRLRRAGRSVELVLEAKKMKWAIKVWEV